MGIAYLGQHAFDEEKLAAQCFQQCATLACSPEVAVQPRASKGGRLPADLEVVGQ